MDFLVAMQMITHLASVSVWVGSSHFATQRLLDFRRAELGEEERRHDDEKLAQQRAQNGLVKESGYAIIRTTEWIQDGWADHVIEVNFSWLQINHNALDFSGF